MTTLPMYQVTLKWWLTNANGESTLDLEFVHYADARRQYDAWIAQYSVIIANADGNSESAHLLVTLCQDMDLYCKFEATAG